MYEDGFQQKFISSPYIAPLKIMATQIKTMLVSIGKPVTRKNVFWYLLDPNAPFHYCYFFKDLDIVQDSPLAKEKG